ncbi:probable xyloglucan endotransglucosylase/hydrolase protein 30 isoform X1 [Phoenix dactylifera]|uniref:Xyloglucan endotransglucosylase/hydrolase n=1 Tax=Phoenix dactylifera TaxID=42345 RepID=A0A8B7CMS7_PHODC|nr:probable xyloglucan endotransglucosylase/hydrolase protein 30 isoform X1 [Phoenix dactylifera]
MDPHILMSFVITIFVATMMVTAGFDVPLLAFEEGYSPLFGEGNLIRSVDGRNVHLILNHNSGAGFISTEMYHHGLFSASIKLPSDYTAGIVVAFYTSNGDVFEKNHDELDFEFLGNIRGKEWRVQTNVYGNGSVSRGREERYNLPFDPTKEFHRYSIIWTTENIIFYIDDTPIREVRRTEAMGGDYPSKPMSLYATIWDASNWATSGGRYKVDYSYAPFVSEFTDLALLGCRLDPLQQIPSAMKNCSADDAELMATGLAAMTPEKRQAMLAFRQRYMTYSFCYDTKRYPVTFPDCDLVESERSRFRDTGHLRPGGNNRATAARRVKPAKSRRIRVSGTYPKKQADM